ncbi:MAG: AbrB family transcriptional regulator [Rhodospirillales bacterium]
MNLQTLTKLFATLIIGAVGGWALNHLNVPLAWMLGAMMLTAVLSARGAPLKSAPVLRAIMLCVLGVSIGSTFNPAVFDSAGEWAVSLGMLAFYSIASSIAGATVLIRWAGWTPATAFFSAVPGGLTDMILAGSERGGDERVMALLHTLRIMVTVLIIPLTLAATGSTSSVVPDVISPTWSGLSAEDLLWLAVTGIGGMAAGKMCRLPAYVFTGPMIASAAIHILGLSASRPPSDIVNAAQVVIGVSIGCRFVGINLAEARRTMIIGTLFGLALVGLGAAFAAVGSQLTGASFSSLWLAFAPGGLAEMVLMGLSLGLDPAFVSTHHLFRFLLILGIARLLYSAFIRYRGGPPQPPPTDG